MTQLEDALKPEVRRSPDTVTRTFRIDRDVDRKMEGLSSEGRVSMNQMANKALRRYVEWEVNAEKFGTVTTSRQHHQKIPRLFDDRAGKGDGKLVGRKPVQVRTSLVHRT